MDTDNKWLNFLVICGIINLVSLILFFIFTIVYACNLDGAFNNFDFNNFFNENKVAIIIIFVLFASFDIIPTICIFSIKWESDWNSANKLLYGILNIFFPFLIPFIYAGISRTK